MTESSGVPGFVCVDHVAVSVRPGELDAHVLPQQFPDLESRQGSRLLCLN